MKISRPMPVLAFLIAGTLIAQDAKVTPLMSKDLAECPGKEGLMITVVYPPGASDSYSPAQCVCISLRAGRLGCDAVERRERSHAHARPDILRRAQRHSYRWPECKQH